MADRKIVSWFTVNGRHIPVFEGEKKSDAFKRVVKYDDRNRKNPKKYSSSESYKKLSQPTTKEAKEYYLKESKKKADLESEAHKKLHDDDFMEHRYAGDLGYEHKMQENYRKAKDEATKAHRRMTSEREKPEIKSVKFSDKAKEAIKAQAEKKARQIAQNKAQADMAAGKKRKYTDSQIDSAVVMLVDEMGLSESRAEYVVESMMKKGLSLDLDTVARNIANYYR